MSEGYEIELLLEVGAMLFHLGQRFARQGEPAPERHLLRQGTQITDGALLRRSLEHLGLRYQEGDPAEMWGGDIAIQVVDEDDRPWFALAWDERTEAYVIYRQDPAHAQDELPEDARLSERDPTPTLARLAQQYGYFKTLRALLQEGYRVQDTETQRADGARVLVLQRRDPVRDETHTVRLVLQAEDGQATLLTDSRRADGTHGVCPEMEDTLHAMGVDRYDRWAAPVVDAGAGDSRETGSARFDGEGGGPVQRRTQDHS